MRNRIISGLSNCIILIESGTTGGTFHQAQISISQGRKVFALKPQRKNKEAFKGFEQFLKMGVTPITDYKPVLEYLNNLSSITREKKIDAFYQHQLK